MAISAETDGDRLKAALAFQGRSARWLAGEIHMDETGLSKAIKGEPHRELSPTQQEAIARILGIPTTWIFRGDYSGQ